jgi:hypothetical protein
LEWRTDPVKGGCNAGDPNRGAGVVIDDFILDRTCRPPAIDVSSTAIAYSSFAGLLAAFGLATIAIYVQRSPGIRRDGARVNSWQVTTALIYSAASLLISTFLYANLTAQATDRSRAGAELLLYGGVLGVSILLLLYAVTLMIYENSDARSAARWAYWITVIAGPAVIFRFLVDAAQNARTSVDISQCKPPELSFAVTLWGSVGIGALVIVSALISLFDGLGWTQFTREKLVPWFAEKPGLPGLAVFAGSTLTAILSILVTEPVAFTPSRTYYVGIVLGAEFAFLVFFQLACGCVIGERIPVSRASWRRRTRIEVNIPDSFDPHLWLSEKAAALAGYRKETVRGMLSDASLQLWTMHDAGPVIDEVAGAFSRETRMVGSGRHFESLHAPFTAREIDDFRYDVQRLTEDIAVLRGWYNWFYQNHPHSPQPMFGAIRDRLELSKKIADGLARVERFLTLLAEAREAGQQAQQPVRRLRYQFWRRHVGEA